MYGERVNFRTLEGAFQAYGNLGAVIEVRCLHGLASGQAVETILFDEMVSQQLRPNSATLVTILSAGSHLGSSEKGEKVHHYVKEGRFDLNVTLVTA
ncbi:hypothetical protein GH714_017917 [Hevea brasiliensis]|uniref:Uncharacterized protein n=1 Tax=Hevea brasiliensis TaxID=3981 RepID=A0A6A6K7E7_HEVBR|nr:hypothetical protein GH714_017917 [Hevea brasiliensis]